MSTVGMVDWLAGLALTSVSTAQAFVRVLAHDRDKYKR